MDDSFMDEMESEESRRDRVKNNTLLSISVVGWLLTASNLNVIIFRALPLRIGNADWYLDLISAVLSSSPFILLGLVMACLPNLFRANGTYLSMLSTHASRLASLACVVVLLTVPCQFWFGKQALNNQTIQINSAVSNLKGIIKGIQATNSETELRGFVASLPNAPTLPAKFDAPFAVIKERAITNIQAQVNAGTTNIETQTREGVQLFFKEAMRNTAQAILMATAFAALANICRSTRNFATNFLGNFF
ncbi:MAG: hypothetical protein ACKO45_00260 [Cyanobium sp.]